MLCEAALLLLGCGTSCQQQQLSDRTRRDGERRLADFVYHAEFRSWNYRWRNYLACAESLLGGKMSFRLSLGHIAGAGASELTTQCFLDDGRCRWSSVRTRCKCETVRSYRLCSGARRRIIVALGTQRRPFGSQSHEAQSIEYESGVAGIVSIRRGHVVEQNFLV